MLRLRNDAVRDAGGVVIAHRSLTAEDLVAFGMALGEEAELEAAEAEAHQRRVTPVQLRLLAGSPSGIR